MKGESEAIHNERGSRKSEAREGELARLRINLASLSLIAVVQCERGFTISKLKLKAGVERFER